MENEILALMNKTDEEDAIGNIIYNLMSNLHQPYSEILGCEEIIETEHKFLFFKWKTKQKITREGMPLPLILKLLQIMNKESKKMQQAMRRKK